MPILFDDPHSLLLLVDIGGAYTVLGVEEIATHADAVHYVTAY